MRRAGISTLFSLAIGVVSLLLVGVGHTAAAQAGITVTPAALTLNLKAGSQQATTTFTVTNLYGTPVILDFAFEQDTQAPVGDFKALASQLGLAAAELSVDPGQSVTQTITLNDSQQLAPGGQQLNLVVRQVSEAGAGVGVVPSIRLPLVVVKEAGAVTKLGFGSLSGAGLHLGVPHTVSATLHNSGNMIAIPHGVVTLTAPGGRVIGQGTVNVASAAVVPGHDITLSTPVTSMNSAVLPGFYRVQLSYGLGGDHPAQLVSVTFFYIAWWHIVAVLLLGAGAYYLIHRTPMLRRQGKPRKKPPIRAAFNGRAP